MTKKSRQKQRKPEINLNFPQLQINKITEHWELIKNNSDRSKILILRKFFILTPTKIVQKRRNYNQKHKPKPCKTHLLTIEGQMPSARESDTTVTRQLTLWFSQEVSG